LELRELAAARAASAPDGRLAVIEGEAGIGKSRLAGEVMASAEGAGGVVLATSCHDDEAGLPYGPVLELLAEAQRTTKGEWPERVSPQRLADASLLAPELSLLQEDVPKPVTLSGPGARVRLLEGVAEVLAAACGGAAPGVLFVDDVHAADEATVDVLAYLGRRLRGRAVLLMVGWRSEGVPPGHRLRRLAADLTRDGSATIVRLARLDEKQVSELVHAGLSEGTGPDLERRVYVETEGLPLFVAEYLAAMRAGGGEGSQVLLPNEVTSLLGARLGGLGAVARQVLGAAAAIGRSFDIDIVREASGRSDEETVTALEELVSHGVVREAPGPEPLFDFSHQKLRALVYQETGLARRRLLHRRIAAALSRRGHGVGWAAPVAQHQRLGGQPAAAAESYRLAAEHAASLLAHADALEHLEAALALAATDSGGLHERIGDLRTLVGDYSGALESYESAAALSESEALAALEQKLGEVHQRRGEWERAEARFAAALEAAPQGSRGLRARIKADLSLTSHQQGRIDAAATLASEARELSEAAGDRLAQAQAHNMLGVLARAGGDLERARSQLGRSLALAIELDDAPARVAALNNLALVSREASEPERALELTREALALCATSGDRHREAALENNLADLHHAAGRGDEAMAHLKRAVAIFSEVGADEATRLPEIWKLVSW
jgi:predicted ATPase